MDMIGGGLSLLGGLAGMFGGGGAQNVPLPKQFDTSGITNQLSPDISSLTGTNLGGQNLGEYSSFLQSAINNPYAGQAQGFANAFSPLGIGTSLGAIGNAGQLGGEVPGMLGAAGNIFNTAFDPQNALYNRTAQQVSDQTNASLAGSGIGNTPWGQGVLGNTMSNFNIDWQNNLLNRMSTGAGAAGGLINQAGNTASGAFNLGSAGAQGGAGFGAMPWNTYNTIGGMPLQLLQGGAGYGNTSGQLPQQQIGDLLQFLQSQNQANQGAGQLGLEQQQNQFKQNQIFGSEIGGGLGMMGKAFGMPNYGNTNLPNYNSFFSNSSGFV